MLTLFAGCLTSCSIPVSTAVQAHAAGEQAFSPVAFAVGARASAPASVSPEAEKSKAFWGN